MLRWSEKGQLDWSASPSGTTRLEKEQLKEFLPGAGNKRHCGKWKSKQQSHLGHTWVAGLDYEFSHSSWLEPVTCWNRCECVRSQNRGWKFQRLWQLAVKQVILEIDHGGNMSAMKIGKCHKSGLFIFFFIEWVVNIHSTPVATAEDWWRGE